MIRQNRVSRASGPSRGFRVLALCVLLSAVPSCVPVPNGGNGDVPTDGTGDDGTNGNDNGGGDPVAGLPLAAYETDNFVGPTACAACHTALTDAAGNDVSIDTVWRATMMANAAKDPFFKASVEAEVAAAPALAAVIEATCASCHTPSAHTQALADGGVSSLLGAGFYNEGNALHVPAMDGVSCSLCHQITDAFQSDPESGYSGGYVIDTETDAPDRLMYGPFADPVQPSLMQGSVGFTPVLGAHIEDSGLCATCHTLFTPTLDASGEVVGEFPEQVPYLEWKQSSFADGGTDARSCQSCHMPLADGPAAISRLPSGLAAREMFYQHVFRGGNMFMLKLLRDNIEELELSASTENFNDAIALTAEFLGTETADVDIAGAAVAGDTLSFEVGITNKAGHKFPTSFPSRRAWLHVTVTNGNGETLFESGAWDDEGRIAGDDGDADVSKFERHYDEITSADMVQVYQAVMGNTDGDVTYTLLRGDVYLKDNRLLPAGFDKYTATGDTAVQGAASSDDDFIGGSDEVTYRIDIAGHDGPFTVSVELVYQSVSYPFAHDLAEQTGTFIDEFNTMFDAADKTPTLIDSGEVTVP